MLCCVEGLVFHNEIFIRYCLHIQFSYLPGSKHQVELPGQKIIYLFLLLFALDLIVRNSLSFTISLLFTTVQVSRSCLWTSDSFRPTKDSHLASARIILSATTLHAHNKGLV